MESRMHRLHSIRDFFLKYIWVLVIIVVVAIVGLVAIGHHHNVKHINKEYRPKTEKVVHHKSYKRSHTNKAINQHSDSTATTTQQKGSDDNTSSVSDNDTHATISSHHASHAKKPALSTAKPASHAQYSTNQEVEHEQEQTAKNATPPSNN